AVVDHRPNLDGPPTGGGNPPGRLDRLVEVVALDQIEPAELFFGLGERPVGGHGSPAVEPCARGRGRGSELLAAPVPVPLAEPGREVGVLPVDRLPLVVGGGVPAALLRVDQQRVLHGIASSTPAPPSAPLTLPTNGDSGFRHL